MADDPLAQLSIIGQKALAVPTDLLNVGSRRMTEDVSMMTAKIQDIGATLVPPAGGLALPQLPLLPGMAGAEAVVPAATRSEKVQGVKTTRKMSYLKV